MFRFPADLPSLFLPLSSFVTLLQTSESEESGEDFSKELADVQPDSDEEGDEDEEEKPKKKAPAKKEKPASKAKPEPAKKKAETAPEPKKKAAPKKKVSSFLIVLYI